MKNYKLLLPLLSSILMNACTSNTSPSQDTSANSIPLRFTSFTSASKIEFGASGGVSPTPLTDTSDNASGLISHTLSGLMTLTKDRSFNELIINQSSTLINQKELSLGVMRVKSGTSSTNVYIENTDTLYTSFLELDGTTAPLTFDIKTAQDKFSVSPGITLPKAPFNVSPVIIQIKGNVTWNLSDLKNENIDIIRLDKGDNFTVSKGVFTTPNLLNRDGNIIIKDSSSSIKTTTLFRQDFYGTLTLLDDGSNTTVATKIPGTEVDLAGTLQILTDGNGFKQRDEYILVNASSKLYGTFDQVVVPFGAIYYEGNQVIFRQKTFAPIEQWRTKIKLESRSKYLHDDFTHLDTSKDITDTTANRVDITESGVINLGTLTNVGRLRVYGSNTQNSSVTLNLGNLTVQDLEIISPANTLAVKVNGNLNFSNEGNLVPNVGFSNAKDAPIMLSNRGNTNWGSDLEIQKDMIFAHKDGRFNVPNLTNNGTMVLDGSKANVEVTSAFKHTGKIVVLHESRDKPSISNPKIIANSVDFNGTIEVISDETSQVKYPVIKSGQKITGDLSKLAVVSPDQTLISYQPTATTVTSPMTGLQNARMDILSSAVSRQLAPISLSIAPNINLGLFAQVNEKNPKEMGTFEGSMRFGDFEMSVAHLALDLDMAKNTKVQAFNIGTSHVFRQNGINFTPSLKLGYYTAHSSGMNVDVGSLRANEMHFSQNILSLGGKLNFDKNSSWNPYVEAYYHHCPDENSTTKVKLGSHSAKWEIQGTNLFHLKAGITNYDQTLAIHGEFMQMGDLNYKMSFQVDFKQ